MIPTRKDCLFAAMKSEAMAALLCALILGLVILAGVEWALPDPPQTPLNQVAQVLP